MVRVMLAHGRVGQYCDPENFAWGVELLAGTEVGAELEK